MNEANRIARNAKAALDQRVPQQAIHRQCIDCAYDDLADGSMAEQITGCKVVSCALFPFRPRPDGTLPLVIAPNPRDSRNIQRKDALIRKQQMKGTPRAAIAAYCLGCNFDAAEPGTWRDQIRACQRKECSLWQVRPK